MKQRSHIRRRIHERIDHDGQPDTLIYRPTPLRIVRKGIQRVPRERTAAARPLTEEMRALLALLGDEPRRPVDLARILSAPPTTVTSRLYAIQDRGLAERVPYKGWRRTTPITTQEERAHVSHSHPS